MFRLLYGELRVTLGYVGVCRASLGSFEIGHGKCFLNERLGASVGVFEF